MAGIGFELRKIYKKEGIARGAMGLIYSSLVTIGPMILVISAIMTLYILFDVAGIPYAERELLFATILYIFIFSMLITSPLNVAFSRYVADRFFEEEYDGILDSYYVGLLSSCILATIAAIPVGWSLYTRGGVGLSFILGAYVLWISVTMLFFSITYLHATKEYKTIACFFLIGMLCSFALAYVFHYFMRLSVMYAILYALAVGFFVIAVLDFAYIKAYFSTRKGSYWECLKCVYAERRVMLANLLYSLGLYVHNFVFWSIPQRTEVAETFYSNQAYDMASCLAMFTNIFVTVSFTVVSETRFHDVYKDYMESVLGGTHKMIAKNKKKLFRTLRQQISQIFGTQIAITTVVFVLVVSYGTLIGVDNISLSIYPVLVVAYLGIFLMNGNLIYLYYFADTNGALMTGFVFFLVTFIGSLFARELPTTFWGIGPLFGMLAGWAVSYFRIRWLERNLESYIFCAYKVVDSVPSTGSKFNIVYKKNNGIDN